MIKKLAAFVLAMAMLVMSGCSTNYEKVVTVDGVDIAPNVYLYAQYQSYLDAKEEVEEGADVLSATIEEVSAEEWIHNKTIERLKKYVWVEKAYEAGESKLAEGDTDYIDQQVSYYWAYAEQVMADNGIGLETYTKAVTNEYIAQYILFQNLYGKGGEREPSDDEVREYMDATYARIHGFQLPKVKYGTEEFVDADSLVKIGELASQAAAELNEGADFDEVVVKYSNLAAEITGDETEYTTENITSKKVERYLNKTNIASYEEVLTANAFLMEAEGEWECDDLEKQIIVYQKKQNLKDQTELDYYKLTLASEMKSDDYEAYIQEQTAGYEVVEDSAAVKFYSVNKIK